MPHTTGRCGAEIQAGRKYQTKSEGERGIGVVVRGYPPRNGTANGLGLLTPVGAFDAGECIPKNVDSGLEIIPVWMGF